MNNLIYPRHESLYFHNSLAYIVESPGEYARVEWQAAPMFSSSLREVYEQLLQLLKEKQLRKVLSDHQLMPAIMPKDQQWLATDWVPRAVQESGYRYCAIINAHDAYNRLSTNQIEHKIRGSLPLQIAHFQDQQAASSWLLNSVGL
jgi:elongation factor P--beta-lysine ligase